MPRTTDRPQTRRHSWTSVREEHDNEKLQAQVLG